MHSKQWLFIMALWSGASAGCASTPSHPTFGETHNDPGMQSDAATSPSALVPMRQSQPDTTPLPAEPSCSSGSVKRFVCGPVLPTETPAGYARPLAHCPESRDGKPFSPAETRSVVQREPKSCCFLDHCDISYGY